MKKFKEYITEAKNTFSIGDKVLVVDNAEPMFDKVGVIIKVKKIVFTRLYTVKFENGKTNTYEYDELNKAK